MDWRQRRDAVRARIDSETPPDPVLPHRCPLGCARTFASERDAIRHHRVCPKNIDPNRNDD